MLSVQTFVIASFVVAGVVGTVKDSDWSWSEIVPEDCPSRNNETHVCTGIVRLDGLCIEVDCCESMVGGIAVDDTIVELAFDVDYTNATKTCSRICMTIRYCTVYSCVSFCCDGYGRDEYGRCITKTDEIQCENGGSPFQHHHHGEWSCSCPWNYTGRHCEMERCQCEHGGECVPGRHGGEPQCVCEEGYYGRNCEHKTCPMDCKNGGSCYLSNAVYYEPRPFCQCRTGYTGMHCEIPYTNSHLCPAMNRTSVTCVPECSGDYDCPGDSVCCSEGCTLVCRSTSPTTCRVFDGHTMSVGDIYTPDPCTTCTCEEGMDRAICMAVACAYPSCTPPSKPVLRPGECCQTCDNAMPVKVKGCPNYVITLSTDRNSSGVRFTTANTGISAIDTATGRSLQPRFEPSSQSQCKCNDIYRRPKSVRAYFRSPAGYTAQCSFQVAVEDKEPPYTTSCPKDIYAFDDETVGWTIPKFYDNVGIAQLKATHPFPSPRKFPAGTRFKSSVKAMDFSGNTAQCSFNVDIRSRDSNVADLPQGLRERSTGDNSWLLKILVPALGVLILIVIFVMILICCRRKMMSTHRHRRSSRRSSSRATENIYAVPDEVSVKLPKYNDVPFNPPPYSVSASMKDVTYASLPPPPYVPNGDAKSVVTQASGSYDNPVYGTLSSSTVALSTVAPSTVSSKP